MTKLDLVIAKITEAELQLNRCLASESHENETMNEALIELTKVRIVLEKVAEFTGFSQDAS